MEDGTIQLHFLLTFNVTSELTEHALRGPGVVQAPDQFAAQVAPRWIETSASVELVSFPLPVNLGQRREGRQLDLLRRPIPQRRFRVL